MHLSKKFWVSIVTKNFSLNEIFKFKKNLYTEIFKYDFKNVYLIDCMLVSVSMLSVLVIGIR